MFDGRGHTISNLTITGGSVLGLFGQLGDGAVVSSLGLEAVAVNGTGRNIGGLVGHNVHGSVSISYASGLVSGGYSVGGLVGYNYDGSVSISYSTGAVTGDRDIGGLVGENMWGDITRSYSNGTVNGNTCVGGLIGQNCGSATHCYSTSTVEGDSLVGGLVGCNFFNAFPGVVTGCFWDIQTSGQDMSDGGTGLATAQMQDLQTYLKAGWDLLGEIHDGTSEIWLISPEGGYPVLAIFSGYIPPQLEGRR